MAVVGALVTQPGWQGAGDGPFDLAAHAGGAEGGEFVAARAVARINVTRVDHSAQISAL